jgi:hypothetical protein
LLYISPSLTWNCHMGILGVKLPNYIVRKNYVVLQQFRGKSWLDMICYRRVFWISFGATRAQLIGFVDPKFVWRYRRRACVWDLPNLRYALVSQPHFERMWEWNSHSRNGDLGVFRDSQNFRVRLQESEHLTLGCFLYHWKAIEV